MINRRQLLQRDEPIDFKAVLATLRGLGYSTADLAFILNVHRSTLWSWEANGCIPNFEDGRAILKLCRNSGTSQGTQAA